jgi:hypothetical protein
MAPKGHPEKFEVPVRSGKAVVASRLEKCHGRHFSRSLKEVMHPLPKVRRLDEIRIGARISLTESTTTLAELQTDRSHLTGHYGTP